MATFVAGTARRSVGVEPACAETREEVPPRPLGVGVVDGDEKRLVICSLKKNEEEELLVVGKVKRR